LMFTNVEEVVRVFAKQKIALNFKLLKEKLHFSLKWWFLDIIRGFNFLMQ